MTKDLIELTLELLNPMTTIQCPLCMWDNDVKTPTKGTTFSCGCCYLEIKVLTLKPITVEALSDWYNYYGGGA